MIAHTDNADAVKKEKEYQFLKEEYKRRKQEDELRLRRREEEDTLRKSNPDVYFGRILKLTGRVSMNQIKQRYKELVKQYHPDKFEYLDAEFAELATRRTQQITEAFQFFSKKYGFKEPPSQD